MAKKELFGMDKLHEDLKSGEKVYIGTKNKYWFLQRFKDATGVEAQFTRKIKENMYQIKLKK